MLKLSGDVAQCHLSPLNLLLHRKFGNRKIREMVGMANHRGVVTKRKRANIGPRVYEFLTADQC